MASIHNPVESHKQKMNKIEINCDNPNDLNKTIFDVQFDEVFESLGDVYLSESPSYLIEKDQNLTDKLLENKEKNDLDDTEIQHKVPADIVRAHRKSVDIAMSSADKEASDEDASTRLLPPCKVCGDKASGFHYGVNTCEACKGFFRRSMKRNRPYKKSCSANCFTGFKTRSVCAFCRYDRCISSGMSKTAIKTGRYTHEKRAKDIEEVRKVGTKVTDGGMNVIDKKSEYEQSMEEVIRRVAEAHEETCYRMKVSNSEREKKVAEYLEQKSMREKVFGRMTPLTMDEYREFYQATGVDIDGRRELMTVILQRINVSIKRCINFCKSLPGFSTLLLEDQMSLIKASRYDFRLLTMHRWMDVKEKLFVSYDMNVILHRDDFTRLGEVWEDHVGTLFQIAARMQKLHLHDIELAFLKAISVFSVDRCDLKEPEKVEQLQDACIEALQYHWRKYRPDRLPLLGGILIILTDMRTMCHQHANTDRDLPHSLKHKFSLEISDIPPLMLEMTS